MRRTIPAAPHQMQRVVTAKWGLGLDMYPSPFPFP